MIVLTNINCLENCIYQKDGKCSFENISSHKINTKNSSCAYFVEASAPKLKQYKDN